MFSTNNDYKILSEKEKLDLIINYLSTSPTSFGCENWRAIIIKDKKIKDKLFKSFNSQIKILESKYLIIFYTDDIKDIENHDLSKTLIIDWLNYNMEKKDILLKEMAKNFKNHNLTYNAWARSQSYIALGYLLVMCNFLNVKATAIEGFNPKLSSKVLLENNIISSNKIISAAALIDFDSPAKPTGWRIPKNDKFKLL